MAKVEIVGDDSKARIEVSTIGYTPAGLRWRVMVVGGGMPFARIAGYVTRSQIRLRSGVAEYRLTGTAHRGIGRMDEVDVMMIPGHTPFSLDTVAREVARVWSLSYDFGEGVTIPTVDEESPLVHTSGK